MECNKDEAVRAKGIAVEKLLERDVTGAKKFALKAQTLFPELDGLSQFLEIINVHVAYENKINGEADYYGIFGVDPLADEELLRKQYKRLALSLHPDKNKSVGADGAFKILSEAWSVLSNKHQRSVYNMKLNIRASNQTGSFSSSSARYNTTTFANPTRVPPRPRTPGTATCEQYTSAPHHPWNTTSGTFSEHIPSCQQTPVAATVGSQYNHAPCRPAPDQPPHYQKIPVTAMDSEFIPIPPCPRNPAPSTNNQYFASRNPQVPPSYQQTPAPPTAAQNIPAHKPPLYPHYTSFRYQTTSMPRPSRSVTFWTLCNRCRINYEYQKLYLNQILMCPHCQQPFLASEKPAPSVNSRRSCLKSVSAASTGSGMVPDSTTRTYQAASFQPSSKFSKRKHEAAANMERDTDVLPKTSRIVPEKVEVAPASNAFAGLNREKPLKKRRTFGWAYDSAKKGSEGTAGGSSGDKRASSHLKRNSGAGQESRRVKELSQAEIRVMLMGKAKMEILGRIKDWGTEKSKSCHMERVETKDSVNDFNNDSINHPRADKNRYDDLSSDPKNMLHPQKSSILEETDDVDANPDESVSMTVPDANFHNFDEDRVEVSFTENQIWAAYDDDDGMPRYYALVHHVISRNPFKMQISWLNYKSSSEFGSIDWIGSGFTKTTGDFRVGKSVVSKRLNSFSHPVKWKKGAKGIIQIFPTKGDVWALYRNWSPDWDEDTADEMIHVYDLVVVLEDYNEDIGILVAPLVKVAGFTSVFNQILDQIEIRKIPREEMFRFSHQVPFCMLNGLEAENAPKGCYELDPAALPLELLKVITDSEAAEERVSGHPVMLAGSEIVSEATAKSNNAGKTNETEERSGAEGAKCLLTYSRRNKGKKRERDPDQSNNAESNSAGKTHATEERIGVEDAKCILTYSKRNKGTKMERDLDQSEI